MLVCTLCWVQRPQLALTIFLHLFFSSLFCSVYNSSPHVLSLWTWAGWGKPQPSCEPTGCDCDCVRVNLYIFLDVCVPLHRTYECVHMCVCVRQITQWKQGEYTANVWQRWQPTGGGELCHIWVDILSENSRKQSQHAENMKETENKASCNQTQEMTSACAPRGVLYAYESVLECTCQHVQQLWSS